MFTFVMAQMSWGCALLLGRPRCGVEAGESPLGGNAGLGGFPPPRPPAALVTQSPSPVRLSAEKGRLLK